MPEIWEDDPWYPYEDTDKIDDAEYWDGEMTTREVSGGFYEPLWPNQAGDYTGGIR